MGRERILLLDLASETGLASQLSSILQSELLVDMAAGDQHLDDRLISTPPQVVLPVGSCTRIGHVKSAVTTIRQSLPLTPVIVALDFANSRNIFELLEWGVSDFIILPYSRDEVLARVRRIAGQELGSASVMEDVREKLFLRQLVGTSPIFRSEVNKISIVARAEASVLITGETGVGKDLVARGIHYLSRRARHAFVPINCGAVPGELFENELFGHEAGAFTSASVARTGLIEEADSGTLFLDEIDALSVAAQVKLLRFLQEKEYRRLGSTTIRRCDVRVIAATNTCPEAAVRAGRLRPDLYYRLNVVTLTLPPLRDRRDDIPQLAGHFLARYAGEMQKRLKGFSANAMARLVRYSWPGNVRELEHVVERAVIFAKGPAVEMDDVVLPEAPATDQLESFRALKARAIEQFERDYIMGLLASSQGNISSAARAAKKNRRAFFQLMRKHGIHGKAFKTQPT
jgi:DNA-binding NtrC family response regulator